MNFTSRKLLKILWSAFIAEALLLADLGWCFPFEFAASQLSASPPAFATSPTTNTTQVSFQMEPDVLAVGFMLDFNATSHLKAASRRRRRQTVRQQFRNTRHQMVIALSDTSVTVVNPGATDGASFSTSVTVTNAGSPNVVRIKFGSDRYLAIDADNKITVFCSVTLLTGTDASDGTLWCQESSQQGERYSVFSSNSCTLTRYLAVREDPEISGAFKANGVRIRQLLPLGETPRLRRGRRTADDRCYQLWSKHHQKILAASSVNNSIMAIDPSHPQGNLSTFLEVISANAPYLVRIKFNNSRYLATSGTGEERQIVGLYSQTIDTSSHTSDDGTLWCQESDIEGDRFHVYNANNSSCSDTSYLAVKRPGPGADFTVTFDDHAHRSTNFLKDNC